jgi:hypothetical protein
MKVLIGETGVIGKTLSENIIFDYKFNSKNISDILKLPSHIDEIYLSCLPAQKWIVNKDKFGDVLNICSIIEILSKFSFGKLILISTIDVYLDTKIKSDEDSNIVLKDLHYGTNRLLFEMMVKQFLKYQNLKIFRLPGIFGKNFKKNIIFDLLTNNNIDKINLNSSYQWYNLENLVADIDFFSENFKDEVTINLFTEPINTEELIKIFGYENCGFYGDKSNYDYITKFNKTGYITDKQTILSQILKFKNEFMR